MSASGIVFSGLPLGVPYNAGILEHIYDRLFGEGYDDMSIASLLSRAVAVSGANPDYEGTDGSGLFGFKKGEYRQNPFLSDDPMEETDRQVDYVLSNRESYQLPEFDQDYLAKAIWGSVEQQRREQSGENDWLDTYMNKWLWPAENSIKAGYKDGRWGVYSDSAGRNIGPGLHEGSFGDVLDYSGNTSYSTEDINRIVRGDLERRVARIKTDLNDIGYGDLWDSLSDGGKAVMLDISYNVGVGGGSPKKWRNLVDSLATGNAEKAMLNMRSGNDRRMAIRQNMYNDFGGDYSEVSPFAKGGKIHIKPENRGKFTALKKRTGHSASWFKAHGTPAQKKMATFALNARKWKHGDGGWLYEEGGELQDSDEYSKGFTPKYRNLSKGYKDAVTELARKHGFSGRNVSDWYESEEGRRVLGAYYQGIPMDGRVRRNDTRTSDKSEAATKRMHQAIIKGNPGGNIPTGPYRQSVYDVPYIIDKEAKVAGNRISLNTLDSLAKYAGRAGISLQEGLGLYRQETAEGSIPFENTGDGVDNNALMNANYHREYGSIPANYLVRDFEYDRIGHEVDRNVPPLLHAFNYFKAGKYNPGDPNHTKDVLNAGNVMLNDKVVQDWMETSPYVKGVQVRKAPRKK